MGLFKGKSTEAGATSVAKKPAAVTSTVAKKAAPAGKPPKELKAAKEPKPKNVGTAASSEELADAIGGRLKPRELKGSKNQDSLTAATESGRPKGRPLGVTTGLPILLAWCYIFQTNEKAPKDQKYTDEEITKWMTKEFPGRSTPAFNHPGRARREYNEGKFTRGTPVVRQSKPYDKDGNVITDKPTKGENPTSKVTKPAAAKPVVEVKPRKKTFAVGD